MKEWTQGRSKIMVEGITGTWELTVLPKPPRTGGVRAHATKAGRVQGKGREEKGGE